MAYAYRAIAGQSVTPDIYARGVAEHYADTLDSFGYPYTISVFNMAYYNAVKSRISDLGTALAEHVRASPTAHQLALRDEVRDVVQKYDSGNYIIEVEDDFVDLGDLTDELEKMAGDIAEAAHAVTLALTDFVTHTRNASGEFIGLSGDAISINLDQAQGLGIFYPYSEATGGKALVDYQENELFPKLTQDWGWSNFLGTALPPTGGVTPELKEKALLGPLMHGLYNEAYLYKIHHIYFPIIAR